MGAFGGMIQTTRGRNLQAKALTGVELHFTRIAIGDGELRGSSILDLYTLKHEVKSLDIKKLKTSGGQATVGAVLSNQDITSGFYWREVGLFAQDPDLGEILYCYGNAGGNAEYIPAGGGPDIIEKSIDVISIVGNAQSVTATINSSLTYATAQELQELNVNLNSAIASKETPSGAQTKADAAKTAAQAYTDNKVAQLISSAPAALDTLKELADAMDGDPNLKTNLVNMIGAKVSQADFDSHKNEKATQTTKGHVQVDGTTITANNGVISAVQPYDLGTVLYTYKNIGGAL